MTEVTRVAPLSLTTSAVTGSPPHSCLVPCRSMAWMVATVSRLMMAASMLARHWLGNVLLVWPGNVSGRL